MHITMIGLKATDGSGRPCLRCREAKNFLSERGLIDRIAVMRVLDRKEATRLLQAGTDPDLEIARDEDWNIRFPVFIIRKQAEDTTGTIISSIMEFHSFLLQHP